jgi:hypothetical protein
MGGPDMAPHTPQRSPRPGNAVALLDRRTTARRAPATPWRPSIAAFPLAGHISVEGVGVGEVG